MSQSGPPADLAAAGGILRTERITKSLFTIDYDRAFAGWTAYYHGRWMTRTKKPGPWSISPLIMMIAFGGRAEDML